MPIPLPIAPSTFPFRSSFKNWPSCPLPITADCANRNRARHKISHLQGLKKLARAVVDDDAIFLAVANPDVAVRRIDGQPCDELNLPCPTSLPNHWLMNLPFLSIDNARSAEVVCRSSESVSLGLHSRVPRRCRRRRSAQTQPSPAPTTVAVLPSSQSPRRPVCPSFRSNLPSGLIFITVALPAAVSRRCLRFDRHTVRFFLIADHFFAKFEHELRVRIKLEELRVAALGTLKPQRFPFESSATEGTPPKPGGSTYGYSNVYPIVCFH